MDSGAIHLLQQRKFLPFFLTQFFGAFNDNAFKLAMLTMISYHLTHVQEQSEYYQALAGALFILPFFLFSATAGQLADKYDKAILIRIIKVFEVFLMIIGSFALYYGNIFWMLATLTGMGMHSTFFGPIKYAILPDHLQKKDLLGATGLVDASTFLAILLGTTLGSLAIGTQSSMPFVAIFMTVLVALMGFCTSLFIPSAPSSLPHLKADYFFLRATFNLLKQAKNNMGILVSILIISWFWLLGSVVLTKLPDYTNYVLRANNVIFAVFLALFSIGIALGSLTVNFIYRGKVAISIVPWAMLAFTVFTFDLYWATPNLEAGEVLFGLSNFFTSVRHCRIAFDLFMLAFCAGLYVVPLYTYLQITSQPEERARVIATNNICNALFMVFGALMVMFLLHFSIAIPQIFLILSLLNIIAAYVAWRNPGYVR